MLGREADRYKETVSHDRFFVVASIRFIATPAGFVPAFAGFVPRRTGFVTFTKLSVDPSFCPDILRRSSGGVENQFLTAGAALVIAHRF